MASFQKKHKEKQELSGIKNDRAVGYFKCFCNSMDTLGIKRWTYALEIIMKTMKFKNVNKPVPTKKGGMGRNIHVHSGHVNGSGKSGRKK